MICKFYERLLGASERKTEELGELSKRPSKVCAVKFTLNLLKSLELDEGIVLAGLLLAKLAVDCNLKITRRYLNR